MFFGNYIETFRGAKIQVVCVICASLNAISDAMHVSWSAPSTSLLLDEDSPFDVEEKYIVWLELLLTMFSILGLPLTIYLANKLGPKMSILISSCTSAAAWILIGVGNTKEYLFAARCLAGAAVDATFISSPTYISEIANKNIRGSLVCIGYVMFHSGIIVMYSVGAQTSLRIPPIVGICIIVMQLLTLPFFPESPYYHIRKKNEEAARKCLMVFQEKEKVETELSRIVEEVQLEGKTHVFVTYSLAEKIEKWLS
ncbi:solute carrier family 2, facilitated glucose transporter member 5-like isoform X2 [Coccinella septempunctata]|uniref:solute carrier family 2, facilitated glucose transporter member 5-like isoform X2 n=1 Tax=Coccinella septempunctata TaxID=41139 RepID=UPI001D077DC0|nr:solute carrier family 2, facilitated glucose transporter member 5-like isoform X2 [Coccinella septempunctata]